MDIYETRIEKSSVSQPTSQLEGALMLAARGWPVFPCMSTERLDAEPTLDPVFIRCLWQRWPNALVGVDFLAAFHNDPNFYLVYVKGEIVIMSEHGVILCEGVV